LRGRARHLRKTGVVFFVAGLGLSGLPGFATFRGEAAIVDAAKTIGQGWVSFVVSLAAVLTAGAVFRVWGRVFVGLGRSGGVETSGAKKINEGCETSPAHDIPATMYVPPAVLVLLAIVIGVTPGVHQ